MIKLICSDVDGTLVPDGTRDINPELFEVIGQLKEKGIHVTIASGRPLSSIRSLFQPIEDKLFFIAVGGSEIATSGRVLFHWDMDRRDMEEMVREARQIPGCEIVMNGIATSYLETTNQDFYNWVINGYGMKVTMVEDLLSVRDPVIALSFYHSAHQVEVTFRDFMEKWQDRYQVVTAGTMWMDVQPKGVNKGNAVACLQDSLGVTPEETMVFGDQRNDIPMLQQASHSYAVENALPEVKDAARFRAGRCDEDGVLKILKSLLRERD